MKRMAAVLLLVAALGGVAGCAPAAPTASQVKDRCFTNEALIGAEMRLFYADSGIYPPVAIVVEKAHLACPGGGIYSFDESTGVVTCSVHGHP